MRIDLFLVIVLLISLVGCTSTNESQVVKGNLTAVENTEANSDTLRFEITPGNNIIFKTVLNKTDTLDLFWDTGGTELVLKHSAIKDRTSLLDGKNENYKEVNYEPLEALNSLSLGTLSWDSLTIYPTTLLPENTDGHFGWNLFEDKIVELDYEKKMMIVHSSFSQSLDSYAKLEIEYINTLFCINGRLDVGERSFVNRYLFDTGFQRAIVLDRELRAENKFPDDLPVLKESRLRNSAGTEFINRVVEIDKFCFEEVCSSQIPVQLLSTPNPARFKTHILGNELLKRFNTILDFQNDFVYVKPNSLIGLPYRDAS